MNNIAELVAHMQDVVTTMEADDFVSGGQQLEPDHAIVLKLNLNDISAKLADIIGPELVETFYEGEHPQEVNGVFHMMGPIANLIFAAIQFSDTFSLNTEFLQERLSKLATTIQSGYVDYSICLRLVNVDIDKEFELGNGIRFRKLTPEEIVRKYPANSRFTRIHPISAPHYAKHCVEAVITGNDTLQNAKNTNGIRETDALINSIQHTFIFSDISDKCIPNVTHVLFQSDAESSNLERGVTSFASKPHLLTASEITELQETFELLRDAGNDRILDTVIDRFILGMKRGTHHPNRVNEPNWDKIVDYIIAMETLFLTVNKNDVTGELVYRFRMNGSSIISAATGTDRELIFDALKHLYNLRSAVVHGNSESKVLENANKLIKKMDIDREQHSHNIGRLLIVDELICKWLKQSILHVSKIEMDDRPYRKHHGWEHLAWGSAR